MLLRLQIDRRGRIIQDQNRTLDRQRTGQRYPLLLSPDNPTPRSPTTVS